MRFYCFLLLLVASPFCCLKAELVWKSKVIQLEPKLGDLSGTAVFEFSNNGKSEIEVVSVKSGCGCTTAGIDKSKYKPGETGKIEATFVFGSRNGMHQKRVTVFAEDESGKELEYSLVLKADIPQMVKVLPKALLWVVGKEGESKVVQLDVLVDDPVEISIKNSNDAQFQHTLKELVPNKKYEIVVKPTSLSKASKGVIRLEFKMDGVAPSKERIHTYVLK